MANPAVAPLTSLPPTRSGSSSEIDPKPAAQRDRAEASIGTSTTYPPRAFSAKAQPHPHVPCERRTDPAEPTRALTLRYWLFKNSKDWNLLCK